MAYNSNTRLPIMLKIFAKSKCNRPKTSQGVRIVPMRELIDINPTPVAIIMMLNCFLTPLKKSGKANVNGMKDIEKIMADIVKIIKAIVLGCPERAMIRPKSLNKFPQKSYPELKGSAKVPPA